MTTTSAASGQRPARPIRQRGHRRLPVRAALEVVVEGRAVGHRPKRTATGRPSCARGVRQSRRLVGEPAGGQREQHAPGQLHPEQRRVLALRGERLAASTVQRSRSIEDDEVGGRALDRARPDARAVGRRGRAPARSSAPRPPAASGSGRHRRPRARSAEGGLDAADPVGGQAELDRLVDLGVRRVVRGDRVGRAVEQRRQTGSGVVRRPQRRVDAESPCRTARRRARRPPTDPPRRASHAHRRAPATHSSVRARWCGVTSQVTGSPAAFARRTRSSASAVETWVRCSRAPGIVADHVGEDRQVARRPQPPRPPPASRAARGRSRRTRRSPRRRRSASASSGWSTIGRPERAGVRQRRPQDRRRIGPASHRPRTRRRPRRPARRAPRAAPRRDRR